MKVQLTTKETPVHTPDRAATEAAHTPRTGIGTRKASGLSAGVVLLLTVSACSGGADPEAEVEAAGDEPVVITLQEWTNITDTPMEQVLEDFQEQNPDITVEVAPQIPFGDEYDTRMQTQLGAGTAPTIFRMNDDYLSSFSKEGVLKDLTEYTTGLDTEEYVQALYTFGEQEDGSYTAWTVGVQPRVIYYNKDMFEEAGVELPPTEYTDEGWTWDDFLEKAKALTVPGERWGASIYQDTGHEQSWSINNGHETGIFSEEGTEFTLAEPAAAEALQWVTDLTCEHEVQPPWSELQQDAADVSLFGAGRVAMFEGSNSDNALVNNAVTDFEYDIAPLPGNVKQVNEGSLYLYVVPESTPKAEAEAAWRLLEYMGSEEAGTTLADGGYFVPINRASHEAIESEEGEMPQNLALVAEAAENAISPNFPPENASLARQLYRPRLDAAYNCEQSVEEILTSVTDQVNEALAKG